ncbi:predicted protein [Chaetomium globosum CBS 148.51]|uniref:Uncharacterized protein n=1 Tax=Chaetomium globosum (strain ATCC 6205 / CBS 148.51 / DSM 1962 / NBRC 6347 / NRRL 1970) TaxID=306901 RepID=Q2H9U2_CHAGB|nr:uncharacterized protein CHGG_03012 [Chaetomium globosum CBS 148.51]EAQ91077.1 predicted protein [Chaetomium globosum CBS 148.51]
MMSQAASSHRFHKAETVGAGKADLRTARNEPGFNLVGFDPLPPPVSLGGGGENGPGRSPSSCHRTSSAATDQATFCCCNVILPQSACQPKAQVYVISMSLLQQQPGECLPVFLPAWMLQGTRGGLSSSGWLSSLFPALRILLFLMPRLLLLFTARETEAGFAGGRPRQPGAREAATNGAGVRDGG